MSEVKQPPKKRGRKPKQKTTETLHYVTAPTEKKKRGRKPKPKPLNEVQPEKKKRGRKPKEQVNLDFEKKNISNEEQIILHIPIKNSNINLNLEDQYIKYNPDISIPLPYEKDNMNSNFDSVNNQNYNNLDFNIEEVSDENLQSVNKNVNNNIDINSNKLHENIQAEIYNNNKDIIDKYENLKDSYEYDNDFFLERNKIMPIFLEYDVYNKKKEWPSSTNIHCLWCCHEFNNFPFGIPIKKCENTMYMYGNFCSPECAAAYNFDCKILNNDMWERYSLINYLYRKNNKDIKLAPPRLCLKKFGGRWSINEFRKSNISYGKDYKLLLPPMISVIPYVEEINVNVDNNVYYNSLLKNSNYQRANDDYKLKRSKPLPNSNNTLENCMKLKYIS